MYQRLLQFCLQRVDVVGGHFAVGRYLAVDDLPQPERAGDVAIFVEGDGTDDAFVADRLAVLDQAERLGELVLAGKDRRAGRVDGLVALGRTLQVRGIILGGVL